MIKEIIQLSYLIIVADITLIFVILYNSTLGKLRQRVFLISAVISIFMIACNIIDYSLRDTGRHILLLKIALSISYSISGPVILPFVFLSGIIQKKLAIVLNSMAVINTVLSIISIFNGCVFSINDNGELSLGALSPVPFYFSGVYLISLLYCSLIKFRLGFCGESIFIFLLFLLLVYTSQASF